jgi:hypothetical protein
MAVLYPNEAEKSAFGMASFSQREVRADDARSRPRRQALGMKTLAEAHADLSSKCWNITLRQSPTRFGYAYRHPEMWGKLLLQPQRGWPLGMTWRNLRLDSLVKQEQREIALL